MKKIRTRHTSAFKAKVALEAIKEHKTLSELGQEFGLHPVQISTCKCEFLERSEGIYDSDQRYIKQVETMKKDKDELHRQIGELHVENEWFNIKGF